MDFHLRINRDYKILICMLSFYRKKHFFSKKRLQIENSGFVKTCDEYLHNGVPNGHGDNGTDIQPSCTCTKKEAKVFQL